MFRLVIPSDFIPSNEAPLPSASSAVASDSGRPFSVPRSYSIGTILVVTAAFAGLVRLLVWTRLSGLGIAAVIGFITVVGIAQMCFFSGRRPRLASVLAGIVCIEPYLVIGFFSQWRSNSLEIVVVSTLGGLIMGALLGYCAGCVVGGVFLVMDLVQKAIDWLLEPHRRRMAEKAIPNSEGLLDEAISAEQGSISGKVMSHEGKTPI